jgi:predicted phage terminase large subunit-like protein
LNPKLVNLATQTLKQPKRDREAEDWRRKELARTNFLEFIQYTKPNYRTNWHHELMARKMEDVVMGRCKNLLVTVPARYGKSEQISRRLPAYLFGRNPDAQIISTSYASDLASRMNRDVQRIIESPLYHELYPKTKLSGKNVVTMAQHSYLRNSEIFEIVDAEGSYRCAGVGGGITGMGFGRLENFHPDGVISGLGLIDDPFKNRAEADSERIRESVWEWYTSTFKTRREGDAAIILVQTRWNEDDLAGRLLKLAAEDPNADQWEVLSFPAIAEGELHPEDPRSEGEALWELRHSAEVLISIKADSEYDWASMWQQRPAPKGGGLIKTDWFQHYDNPPAYPLRIIQSWDTAQKKGVGHARWCCLTVAEHAGKLYLLDMLLRRMEQPEGERMVASLALQWNPNVILIEDKSSGSGVIQRMAEGVDHPELLGRENRRFFNVIGIKPEGDKESRMRVETPFLESLRFYTPEHSSWLGDFTGSMSAFPTGAIKDPVDALSQLLRWVREHPATAPTDDSIVVGKPRIGSSVARRF